MLVRSSPVLLVVLVACGASDRLKALEGAPERKPGAEVPVSAGGLLPYASSNIAPAVACEGVEALISLSAQVKANAGATRSLHPIVLAHGFAGFDKVGPMAYFGRAPEVLRRAGYAVYVTVVTPMARSDKVRGPQLAHQLACIAQASGAGRFNLVGHSQGGLDARWVAAQPGSGSLVASVTTVSTPHRGVPVGDVAAGLLPGFTDPLVDALGSLYGLVVRGPEDKAKVREAAAQLSTARMGEFNAATPDAASVAYFSWAGRSVSSPLVRGHADAECRGVFENPQRNDLVRAEFALTFQVTGGDDVPNDGMVSVASARWGAFLGCVPADHCDEVGLYFASGPDPYSGFDHQQFFLKLAGALVERGF